MCLSNQIRYRRVQHGMQHAGISQSQDRTSGRPEPTTLSMPCRFLAQNASRFVPCSLLEWRHVPILTVLTLQPRASTYRSPKLGSTQSDSLAMPSHPKSRLPQRLFIMFPCLVAVLHSGDAWAELAVFRGRVGRSRSETRRARGRRAFEDITGKWKKHGKALLIQEDWSTH